MRENSSLYKSVLKFLLFVCASLPWFHSTTVPRQKTSHTWVGVVEFSLFLLSACRILWTEYRSSDKIGESFYAGWKKKISWAPCIHMPPKKVFFTQHSSFGKVEILEESVSFEAFYFLVPLIWDLGFKVNFWFHQSHVLTFLFRQNLLESFWIPLTNEINLELFCIFILVKKSINFRQSTICRVNYMQYKKVSQKVACFQFPTCVHFKKLKVHGEEIPIGGN